jgi:hypothetical protein
MHSITSLSHLITITVLTAVIFSVLHAKDVSAASAVLNPSFITSSAQARGIENAIHLELHTHVDRQPLSSLLQNIQNEKPLTSDRHLKKSYHVAHHKQHKHGDDAFGHHFPSVA